MGQKARNGGTIGRARLGYLNHIDRDIRTIAVDPERTPAKKLLGRHEPFIDQQLFDRVQAVIDARATFGERRQQHPPPARRADTPSRPVPGDASVVAFDDMAEAAHFWPP